MTWTQDHEYAAGEWQAEWAAIPDLFRFTSAAVEHVGNEVGDLQIDAACMKANLDLTGGLIMAESLVMALAPHMYGKTRSSASGSSCM